jgi:hypothetical protein
VHHLMAVLAVSRLSYAVRPHDRLTQAFEAELCR